MLSWAPIWNRRRWLKVNFRIKMFPEAKIKFTSSESGLQFQLGWAGMAGQPPICVQSGPHPMRKKLAGYTGDYISPELDFHLSFLVKDGKLTLRRRKYGDEPLIATIADGFYDKWFSP